MRFITTISKLLFLGILSILTSQIAYAQNTSVGIGTTQPNVNAVLELVADGNNQGLLVPRLTTIQRTDPAFTANLGTAENGLIVFDSDEGRLYHWFNGQWDITSLDLAAGQGISIVGATITNTGDLDPDDDITNATQAIGDVTGEFPNLTISFLQGNPIDANNPTTNQILKWDGSQWVLAVDETGTDDQTAAEVVFDNVVSGLTSLDIQGALDELATRTDNDNQDAASVPFAPAGSILSNNVQQAIEDLDLTVSSLGSPQAIGVFFDNVTSGLPASDVQTAIDELASRPDDDNQTAAEVPFTPFGTITSNNVQLAIQDLEARPDSDNQSAALVPFTPAGSILSDNVQQAIEDLDLTVSSLGSPQAIGVFFDNVASGLPASDVQTAIDELASRPDDDNQIAAEVPFAPFGTITSNNVQLAIQDLEGRPGLNIQDALSVPVTQVGGITAANVQLALQDLDAAISVPPVASSVGYDNLASGLSAPNVQVAIDELAARPDNDNQDALGVPFAPFGTITSNNVQLAIQDLEGRPGLNIQDALSVPVTPVGDLASVDVQSALEELQVEVTAASNVFNLVDEIPRGDGTNLVSSNLFSDGINIGIGTTTPVSDLQLGDRGHLFSTPALTVLAQNLHSNGTNPIYTTNGSGVSLELNRNTGLEFRFATAGTAGADPGANLTTVFSISQIGDVTSSGSINGRDLGFDGVNQDNLQLATGIAQGQPDIGLVSNPVVSSNQTLLDAVLELGTELNNTNNNVIASQFNLVDEIPRSDGALLVSSNLFSDGLSIGIGTNSPTTLLHTFQAGVNAPSVITVDAEGVLPNQQAGIALMTLGNGSTQLSTAGTKGWFLGARGDAFSDVAQQNDLTFDYNDGTIGNTVFAFNHTGKVGINTSTPQVTLQIEGNDAMLIPNGTTADRDAITTPSPGMFRYNGEEDEFEGYDGTNWNVFDTGTGFGLPFSGNGPLAQPIFEIENSLADQAAGLFINESALNAGPTFIIQNLSQTDGAGGTLSLAITEDASAAPVDGVLLEAQRVGDASDLMIRTNIGTSNIEDKLLIPAAGNMTLFNTSFEVQGGSVLVPEGDVVVGNNINVTGMINADEINAGGNVAILGPINPAFNLDVNGNAEIDEITVLAATNLNGTLDVGGQVNMSDVVLSGNLDATTGTVSGADGVFNQIGNVAPRGALDISGSQFVNVTNPPTSDYNILDDDYHIFITTAGGGNITLPATDPATIGRKLEISSNVDGVYNITPQAGGMIVVKGIQQTTVTINRTEPTDFQSVILVQVADNVWMVTGSSNGGM